MKLFADSQFYNRTPPPTAEGRYKTNKPVPRLMSQLFESEIFIQIGDRHFQIPRDIFSSPGDSPNFFTLGFAVFFASPAEVFPGLDRTALLRPPSVPAPSVPNRSGDVFAELLHILRGYPLHIKNEEHRAQLLRDCRYFHLRGVEQKLIPHEISYDPQSSQSEIVLRLDDLRPSGVEVIKPGSPEAHARNPYMRLSPAGYVRYARPFVDDDAHGLILEIGDNSSTIYWKASRVDFHGLARARVLSLFQVIRNKLDLPLDIAPQLEANEPNDALEGVKIYINESVDLTMDGEQRPPPVVGPLDNVEPPAKRKRLARTNTGDAWYVRRGQWRLSVQPEKTGERYSVVFVPVKLDVYTQAQSQNKARAFLS